MIKLSLQRVLFRAIAMVTKRLCLVILLLVVGCQQTGIGEDKPALPVNDIGAKAKLSKELKIYQNTLFEGKTEEIRIDAATIMLFSEAPLARKILLDALKQGENSAARSAVCRALSQARASQKPIKNKDDFIQPLFEILGAEDFAIAKLAAEATLLFEYEKLSGPLEKIVSPPLLAPQEARPLPVKARLNAIYALKLQPDMRAIFKLIELLDESEGQVAAEAAKALQSLGIPVGKDAETRRQIINELKRKGREAFLRDWLIHQEAQMRRLEAEKNLWQGLYLSALGMIYDDIGNNEARGKFLAEHLVSSKAMVRLWALEKVSQWRVGTKSELPAEVGPILVSLVSDQNRAVRLKTAELLSLMGQLNSAEKLLEQLKIEQDDEVKTELFVALGGACYYAFLPNSGVKIREEIRKQTLEQAAKYLFEQDANRAQKGAEVIKKLLEQDGLTSAEVDRYLGLLAERYNQEKDKSDGVLRGELLGAMAGLCAQSVYRAESARRFAPLFEAALRDETALVRQAAVDGLVYVDKARALKVLRRDFVNDGSITVRKKVIWLAGEVGGQEDLAWLAEKTAATAESEPAWQAMLKIFKRSEAAVLAEWIDRFDAPGAQIRLSDEQKLSVLEMAERKAVGEGKTETLKVVREKLALAYSKDGEFEQAARYFGMLYEAAGTTKAKERVLAELLDVYLRWPNVEAMVRLVDNCLLEKDLDPNSVIVLSVETFLNSLPAGADPNAVLEALTGISSPEARPMWAGQVKRWADRLGPGQGAE